MTVAELRLMPVDEIHALLSDREQTIAMLAAELDNLRHWRDERRALLHQCARLHRQIQAIGEELHRVKES